MVQSRPYVVHAGGFFVVSCGFARVFFVASTGAVDTFFPCFGEGVETIRLVRGYIGRVS